MKTLKLINHSLAKIELWTLVVIVIIMIFLSFLQALLRNFLNEGFLWGDTFLRHLVLWVGFMGASLATQEEKHINIDVFSRFVKGKFKTALTALIYLIASFICGYLTWAAIQFVMEEKEFGTLLFNDVPVWPFQTIIPIGFASMSFKFFIVTILKFENKHFGER
jgi:TRAP-type C4-dicarboxylate transport system permease small subunit